MQFQLFSVVIFLLKLLLLVDFGRSMLNDKGQEADKQFSIEDWLAGLSSHHSAAEPSQTPVGQPWQMPAAGGLAETNTPGASAQFSNLYHSGFSQPAQLNHNGFHPNASPDQRGSHQTMPLNHGGQSWPASADVIRPYNMLSGIDKQQPQYQGQARIYNERIGQGRGDEASAAHHGLYYPVKSELYDEIGIGGQIGPAYHHYAQPQGNQQQQFAYMPKGEHPNNVVNQLSLEKLKGHKAQIQDSSKEPLLYDDFP
jgi:hypothetical protein